MLQARHSPGATRSARPPGPGTPSGPTSDTGPAFTAGPRSRGSTCPGTWRPPSATTWSAWRRTANAWPPSGRPGRPSSGGAELAGWPKPGGPGVAEMMRGLGRILRGAQRQAVPLHAEALAAIRATACTRRRTRGGHTETAEYAQRRGLVDVALASVMRDGLLRVSEAAALRWGEVELAGDGSGRIRIPESKTDQEAEGVVLYLGPAAVESLLAIRPEEAVIDAVTPVFNLHTDTIRRRLHQAARAAGLPGWRDITGHSGRVGMAQDLSAAGFALPELMTAGRWKSPRMPARYTERQAAGRGAVARYYQGGGVEARRRRPGKRAPARWSPFPAAVQWTPKRDREGRHPVVLGRCTPPSGLVLCSMYTTLFGG